MDKKLAGLLGAAAALTTISATQAAPAVGPELPQATSHRDLLDPIRQPAAAVLVPRGKYSSLRYQNKKTVYRTQPPSGINR